MTEEIPVSPDRLDKDAEHLKLLAIFHFICAGLAGLGIGFLLLHYTLFSTFLTNPAFAGDKKLPFSPTEFFAVFRWFYLLMGALLTAGGVANLLSATWIRARRNRVGSMVVAGINCLHMPIGLGLGIFTLMVLSRDSVRRVYAS